MISIAILQARMGSDRLPGKTMMEIGGKPMIAYLVETLKKVLPAERIWMATSEREENDPIRDYCNKAGIHCFSGSEEDVASRYREILKKVPDADVFFRICGDTPYYGGELLGLGMDWIQNSKFDFVSSMPNKGYPMGCNLELFRSRFFLNHLSSFTTKAHKEHVTGFFYEHSERFNGKLVSCDVDGFRYSDYKFSVDTKSDLKLAELMLKEMHFEPWNYTIPQKLELQKRLKKLTTE